MNLADTVFWDKLYVDVPLGIAGERNPVRQWIEKWVAPGTGTCLEIGCFPGRYLAVFGELGYRLSGIDLTTRVLDELPDWFSSRGYQLGEFYQEDFLEFISRTESSFDIVCSFGFIEHFSDWNAILHMHAKLIKPGGLLVVSVPNFKGELQRYLHEAFDRENLARHNLAAMSPRQWAVNLIPLGYEVLFAGPFGRFDFWVDSPLVNSWQRVGCKAVMALIPFLNKLPESSIYAPHCGLIARKIGY